MPTRPTIGRPWPRNAEWARRDTLKAARAVRKLLGDARRALDDRNHRLVEVMLADAQTMLADIDRILEMAKIGVEPDDDADDETARDYAQGA